MRVASAALNLGRFFSSHPLTREAPLRAWGRFISWQLQSRMRDEVIFRWIEGQRLAVRRGMRGATGNVYAGLHEFLDMMLPLHLLREGDLFLDIGSNVGSYTVLASGVRRATTWAFEPDPETVKALKRNVELNKLANYVVIYELALGEADGIISFTRGLDTVNRVADAQETNVRVVPLRQLDSLIGDNKPLMIKMDVEGYEASVVRGAQNLLAGDSLKVMELETITFETEAILTRHGFVRAYYDPFRRVLSRSFQGQQGSNAVFVRDWDFVAARLEAASAIEVLGKSI